jgi:pimeloyl-ACP methyl ester carboxylesterase
LGSGRPVGSGVQRSRRFTEDLKQISVPVLVLHGDDDQIVPYADAGPLSTKLLKNSTRKSTNGFRTACRSPRPTPLTPTS